MKLKSFGCSFMFGTDLADCGIGEPYEKSSQLTWPALLAKNFNLNYECHARPGSGNLRILEKILSIATKNSQCSSVFVIGWTWIDRFDYTVESNDSGHYYDFVGNKSSWKTITPVGNDLQTKVYYKDLHSQYRDKLSSLIYIKTAIDTLKQKNIPFVMTYIDELLFETEWQVNAAVLDLQNYIKPYMTTFEGNNFLDFSKTKGHAISKGLHPLETAHQAAADYMIKIFDKQKIIDPIH